MPIYAGKQVLFMPNQKTQREINREIAQYLDTKKGARIALYEEKGGDRCNYCGLRAELEYFEVDHKMPESRGGASKLSNYQLLCSPCNKRKHDMSDGEFRKFYKLTPARHYWRHHRRHHWCYHPRHRQHLRHHPQEFFIK